MTALRKITSLALAAAFTVSFGSCTPPETSISKTVTLEFDDSYDFSNKGCHGIQMMSNINSVMTVFCEDVAEPEITVAFTFSGFGKKDLEYERDHLDVTKSLTEDGILSVGIIDTTTGNSARSAKNIFKDDSPGIVFSHTSAVITLTLPKCFDSFNISNYNGDLAAKDLAGQIRLYTYETITAENIAFNADDDNTVMGDKGIIISTSRYEGEREDALITSRYGDITYVVPEPADMQGRSRADTIQVLCSEGAVTVDLNGNVCADTHELDKNKSRQYDYSVAHGAALLDLDDYGGGVTFTNGRYIRSVQ